MPLVDTSNPNEYHANYIRDAAALWYNLVLNQPIPVGLPRILIHYCRFAQQFTVRNRARALVNSLPILPGQSVLVVGAGFGWLQPEIAALTGGEVVCIDTGGWVQSVKDVDERAEVASWLDTETSARNDRSRSTLTPGERAEWLDRIAPAQPRKGAEVLAEDLSTGQSRRAVLNRISGNTFDFAITEHVLEWLSDDESQALSDAMHRVAENVAHWVLPFNPARGREDEPNPWNWKHLADTGATTDLLASQPWYTTTSWRTLLPADTLVAPGGSKV